MKVSKVTQADRIERYRIALESASLYSSIAKSLEKLGYTPDKIAKGKVLLQTATELFQASSTKSDTKLIRHKVLQEKRSKLKALYRLHRKKATIIFRNDDKALLELDMDKVIPRSRVKWLNSIKKFYAKLGSDSNMLQKLSSLAVTPEEVSHGSALIAEIEKERVRYSNSDSDSQVFTQRKNSSLNRIDAWMRDFYDVARIALSDSPQRLEALGIVVKA